MRDYLYFRKALRFAPRSMEAASQFNRAVIPGEPNDSGRDPESRKVAENQIVLDLPPKPAGDAELRHSLMLRRNTC